MEDALTLVLLGIAACFLPLVFGLEITMLGSNIGANKASSLVRHRSENRPTNQAVDTRSLAKYTDIAAIVLDARITSARR